MVLVAGFLHQAPVLQCHINKQAEPHNDIQTLAAEELNK